MLPKNRSGRIFFSRGGSRSSSGFSDSRYSTPRAHHRSCRASRRRRAQFFVAGVRRVHDTVEYAFADSRPSSTSSSLICRCPASSLTVGARPCALRQLADRLGQRQLKFLQAARYPDGPPLVPEVTLDLADDRGRRAAAVENSTPRSRSDLVDGLDQADGGDLGEIVQPLAAVAEPAGQVLNQRQVQLNEGRPDARALRIVGRQRRQPLDIRGRGPGRVPSGRRRASTGACSTDRTSNSSVHLDLVLAAHPDPGPCLSTLARRFCSTIDARSSGPSRE